MIIIEGIDTLSKLVKAEVSAKNAGLVNFAAPTEVLPLSSVNVLIGDVIFVVWSAFITIGANSGWRSIQIEKLSGTATIVYGLDLTNARFQVFYNAGAGDPTWNGTAIFTVTADGTLTMRMVAESNVAGSSIGAGAGQLRAYVFRGR
jgi:hypothetical protein